MNIDYTIECDTSYRTGAPTKKRPTPIVVTFLKQSDRDHVFYKRINLKNSRHYKRVWINEDLTPTARWAKTMVRLISRQAQEKGMQCRNAKFSVTVGDVKYSENTFSELPVPLSTQDVKQIQIDHKTIAYQLEYAPFSSLYPTSVKIRESTMTHLNKLSSTSRLNRTSAPSSQRDSYYVETRTLSSKGEMKSKSTKNGEKLRKR